MDHVSAKTILQPMYNDIIIPTGIRNVNKQLLFIY